MKVLLGTLVIFFGYYFCLTHSSNTYRSTKTLAANRRKTGTTVRSLSNPKNKRRRGAATTATNPPCCHFFLWNFVSACRFHLCNYLMKDCVYEGLGGKKVSRKLSLVPPCLQK